MTQEEQAAPAPQQRRSSGRPRPQRRPPSSRPVTPPANPEAPSFLCDVMLGRLARELRLLGVDAEYDRNMGGMTAYRQARQTGRILLTRANKARELPGVMYIKSQVAPEQVAQVKDAIDAGLKPATPVVEAPPAEAQSAPVDAPESQPETTEAARPASDEKTAPAERPRPEPKPAREPQRAPVPEEPAFGRCLDCNAPLEKITGEQARPSVPFFIYQIHHDFRRCTKCKKVFWPGNHVSNMQTRVAPASDRPNRGGRSGRRRN